MDIILATASPYRIEAFRSLGLPFRAEESRLDENFPGRPSDPGALVLELARRKAAAVAAKHESGIVVGFDSVGLFRGRILEKPRSRDPSR